MKTIDDTELTRIINEVVLIASQKAKNKDYFLINVAVVTETVNADVLSSKPFTATQATNIENALSKNHYEIGNTSIIKDGPKYLSITMEVNKK